MNNKRGQVWETLVPWIIGIGVLILMIILYMTLSGKGNGAIDYIKNMLRAG
ncbi:MAG TPA: hypothetical protein VHA12_00630 [Candidatus Nanoarchaeia archaeon]|nr:hypothetical protein [Candidatus Nanoarchaeia archaeon]